MDINLDINTYISDGFKKVCTVLDDGTGGWIYHNTDHSLMFDNHTSWIYFIVLLSEIVKVGETGNPLGVMSTTEPGQPKIGTMSRLGRYRRHSGSTDERVREELREHVVKGEVSIWARKCELTKVSIMVGGQLSETYMSIHKDLEMRYLDHIHRTTGSLPRLNLCRK